MTIVKKVFCVVLLALLAACGGGGGSSGATADGGGGSTPVLPKAADFTVTVDKPTVTNTGSDEVSIKVTAVDAARNVMSGVPVTVTVDNGAVFTPSGALVTGADGTFSGKISIGADKADRMIRYTVRSGDLVKVGVITVSGTALQLSVVPQNPAPGQTVTVRVVVVDAVGTPLPGVNVNAAGIPGVALPTVTANASGVATFSFNAPALEGFYTLVVQSAGASAQSDVRVQSAISPAVPNAVGPVSGASANATPVVVSANVAGSSNNQSEIRALFYAADNKPIPNMRARFSITSTPLPGESVTTGGNIVFSDGSGIARTTYVASTTGSPTNGVVINVCYDVADFAVGTCPNSVTTTLTVSASPVSVTIGTDNKITKTPSGISYIKTFELQVVDSAGNAKGDVQLSAVVDILGYWKGDTVPSRLPSAVEEDLFTGTTLTHKWCVNEDSNRNGVLDTSPVNEDTNRDGALTPRKSDVAIAFVEGASKTDATGLARLQLTYPQNVARWEKVRITVTAGVSGSEGAASYTYVLNFAEDDASNGAFLRPPYGSSIGTGANQGCNTPQ